VRESTAHCFWRKITIVADPIKETFAPEDGLPLVAATGLRGFIAKFTVLKGAQRELWLTFAIKLLIILAYSITNKTLIFWLSSDLGFNDQHASELVGWVWAPAMTVFTLLAGSVTDALGLRRTFFFGVWVCLIARAVMVFSTVKWLALAGGLFPLVIGEALGTPVLLAATRRYSTTRQRSIAFSLIYTIMNVGFFVAARIYDYVRQNLGEHGHFNLFGQQISTYRTLFLVSFLFELTILIPIYFLRRGAEATDDGVRFEAESMQYVGAQFGKRVLLTVRDSALETGKLFKRLLSQSGFYRLLAFLLLIGFLKVIVMQMDYVFPKFGIRELGDGAPIGQLSSINYLLIILLVPTIGALTQRFSAYRMVIVGSIICAASVFIMALPTDWFQNSANGAIVQWLGHHYLGVKGGIHPY